MTLSVIHDHDSDLLVIKMSCKDLLDSDWGDLKCQRAGNSSSLISVAPYDGRNDILVLILLHDLVMILFSTIEFSYEGHKNGLV